MTKTVLYAAPMDGISDKPFRMIARYFTKAPLFTEMVSAHGFRHKVKSALRKMDIQNEKNVIVQLVGTDFKDLIYAAQAAENMGAAGIDINMGCPVRKVVSGGSGAALLKEQEKAAALAEAVANAVPLSVSVKTRLGWKEPADILSFAPRLVSAGVRRITVHARTKVQGFSGHPAWNVLKNVCSAGAELVVNGDICDKASLKTALSAAGVRAAMIGRALRGQPWLLKTLETGKEPQFRLADLITEHFERMLMFYGKKGLCAYRKHLACYARPFFGGPYFCRQVFQTESPRKTRELIKMFFTEPEREKR